MDKVPITFEEKVAARTTRKGKGACWPWNGAVCEGRPCLNDRDVMRLIYQIERGPIPPGLILKRTDHIVTCRQKERCSHNLCVNPWHVEPRAPEIEGWGQYQRDTTWTGTDTSHAAEYKRRGRARRKRNSNGDDGDSQGLDAAAHGG